MDGQVCHQFQIHLGADTITRTLERVPAEIPTSPILIGWSGLDLSDWPLTDTYNHGTRPHNQWTTEDLRC